MPLRPADRRRVVGRRRAAGPRPSSRAGSGRPGRSTAPSAPAGRRRTRRSRRPTARATSRGSRSPRRTATGSSRAAAVGVVAAERRRAGARDQRDRSRPARRSPARSRACPPRSSRRANVLPPSTSSPAPPGRSSGATICTVARPREQHLDLAEAVLGERDAAAQRARALAARHLAVLERAGVAGLGEPGDVRRAGAVDRHARVVPAAQEARCRGGGAAAAASTRQRQPQRSSALPCAEGYASGWRDGAGSLS